MNYAEDHNPFAITGGESACASDQRRTSVPDDGYVEIITRTRWVKATAYGTAIGGALFYPPAFPIGFVLALFVSLPIVALMSILAVPWSAAPFGRGFRIACSTICGAMTGYLCVGGPLAVDTVVTVWAVLLGAVCSGLSSAWWGSRFMLRKLVPGWVARSHLPGNPAVDGMAWSLICGGGAGAASMLLFGPTAVIFAAVIGFVGGLTGYCLLGRSRRCRPDMVAEGPGRQSP